MDQEMVKTENSDCIICIENLSFSYDSEAPVLSNVNLRFRRLESACIVGPNGGGKSTLLFLILGLLKPSHGKISVFGENPEVARLKIGYMPQHIQLDPDFPISVMEVVLMGRLRQHFWGRYSQQDRTIARDAMAEMSIDKLRDRPFSSLSGGQRQRVLIARALACQPELLLLDEPTANVDPGVQEHFYDMLHKLNQRMSILTVSHDLGFVSENVDSVICVNREIHVHPVSELTGDMVRDMYGYGVNLVQHNYRCSEGSHTHA